MDANEMIEKSAYDKMRRDWADAEKALFEKYAQALVERDQIRALADRLATSLHREIDLIRRLDHKPLYSSVEALSDYRAKVKGEKNER